MTTATPNTRNLRLYYVLLTLLQQQRGGIRHSRSRGEYIYNANGRTVPDANIQKRLDSIVEDFQGNTARLAKRLDSGNLTIAQWQERMRREIKDLHRTQYIVGRGGVENMTQRDWGRLGSDLRWMQYDKLDKFALDIADGKRLKDGSTRPFTEAEIRVRSNMYMSAGNKQYWRGKTEAKIAAGYVSKQRFLNPAEHCEDCEDFEAMGRVPIDDASLPPPGEGSVCLTNCKCTMKFYKADGATAAVPAPPEPIPAEPPLEPPLPEPPPKRQLERERFRRFEVLDTKSDAAIAKIEESENEVWNWAGQQSYEAWNGSLSNAERDWMENYKADDYQWINEKLRTGIKLSDDDYPSEDDFRAAKRNIDKAIDNHLGLNDEVTLWRGGSHPDITAALDAGRDLDDLAGMIIEDKAYMSTSVNPNAADDFVKWAGKDAIKFEIQAPRGTKGVFIDYMDPSLKEFEYLLARGSKMEILEGSMVDGVRHIVARLIR